MMQYSAQPRDQILVKYNRFLSFTKTVSQNSKNVSCKYSQKLLDNA